MAEPTDPVEPTVPADPAKPAEPAKPVEPKKSTITPARIALWIIVGGIGLFMVITGLVGVLVKAQ